MHRKPVLLAATVVSVVGAVLPAGVASAAPARATLSIAPEETGFSGYVSSPRRSCAAGRRVTMVKLVPGRPGINPVASDVAQPNGTRFMWAIQVATPGRYYARVTKTRQCAAAKSRTISTRPGFEEPPAALLGPAPLAAPPGSDFSKVTIRRTGTGVAGDVNSLVPACAEGRPVKVYYLPDLTPRQRREGRNRNIRPRLARTAVARGAQSGLRPQWSVSLGIRGRYFARVERTPTCSEHQSEIVRFVPRP